MLKRFFATAAAMTASSIALGQGAATVDLLDPLDVGFFGIPATTRVMDVFITVAATDVWTAAGVRAVTENGSSLVYHDGDANVAGVQPSLFNPGVDDKFTTSMSKPRGRDAAPRFTNAGAAPAGAYDPPAGVAETLPNLLNVAYFASPPETPGSPSVTGYIARIAVDISGVTDAPADYALWAVGPNASVPAGATVVMRSAGQNQPGGIATATFDVPALDFTSWAMWFVPEPSSLALLVLGGLAAIRRR